MKLTILTITTIGFLVGFIYFGTPCTRLLSAYTIFIRINKLPVEAACF